MSKTGVLLTDSYVTAPIAVTCLPQRLTCGVESLNQRVIVHVESIKKRDDTRAQCTHLRCKHSCACADTPYNNRLGDHAVFDGVTNFVFLCTTNLLSVQ